MRDRMTGPTNTEGVHDLDKVIVAIPALGDSRFKRWGKTLTGVDRTKTNGYAYLGSFLAIGRKAELPVGSYVLLYHEYGSRRYTTPVAEVFQVAQEGTLAPVLKVEGKDWALDLRDKAAELFVQDEAPTLTLTADEEALVAALVALPYDRRAAVLTAVDQAVGAQR